MVHAYALFFAGLLACAACRGAHDAHGAAAVGNSAGAQPVAPDVTSSSQSDASAVTPAPGPTNAATAINAVNSVGSAGAAGKQFAGGADVAAGQAGGAGLPNSAAAGAAGSSTQAARAPSEHKLLEHVWFSGPMLGYDTQYMDRPFDLGAGPFAEVTLTFQLESPCFPFDKWTQSPPPDGQMFPAQCDRFDRLMYFEVDPADQTDAKATPGLQVLRAITPYGGPLEQTVDITDFANTRPGPHSLRNFVGTWVDDQGQVSGSDGGYFLSVTLHVKHGAPARRALAVTPLFSGWVSLDSALTELPFTVPEGSTRARLEYLVTGHGGAMDPSSACIGAAEEFCKRTHHLTVDGAELTPEGFTSSAFVPWRDDCAALCTMALGHPMMGAYCAENPNRAASSVTAPRANWCPGDAVAAITVLLSAAQAAPGMHRVRFAIDDMYPEGRWQVALALYAYGD